MLHVRKIYNLAKELEKNFSGELFNKFKNEFILSEKAVSAVPFHLLKNCHDLKSFYPILVSLERLTSKENLETEFLVTTTDNKEKGQTNPIYFLLENIRSSFNVGSIFRTADSLGVTEVLLTGYTSTPENPKTLKTSLGSTESVKWSHTLDPLAAISDLKCKGVNIYALETSDKAISLEKFKPESPFCLIVGNERFGVSSAVLELCDEIISIPQYGIKNSLNVSVAVGIAGYYLVH